MNRKRLRGLIYEKYKNLIDFSEAIGWHRNKISRILTGVQEPNIDDMRIIANLFELSPEDFVDIFFENQFTKCTN